jgi:hypothetical protein
VRGPRTFGQSARGAAYSAQQTIHSPMLTISRVCARIVNVAAVMGNAWRHRGGHLAMFRLVASRRSKRGIAVTRSIILLSALVGGIAIVETGAANAALVHDLVTFTASNFETDVGSSPAPVDPVTGSFTISFDPTLSYTDETAGITLTPGSLNIALGSTLSFSYNAPTSMLPATTLVVGGISDGAQQVQFNPSTDISGSSSTISPLRPPSTRSAIRRPRYRATTSSTLFRAP